MGVYEGIGMGFKLTASVVRLLICTTKHTPPFVPTVFSAHEAQMTLRVFEPLANRVFAVGCFGAIQSPPCHQGGQLGDGQAKYLIDQNMVDPFSLVWNLFFNP